jgi:anti-anti-sigma regulatory factor
MKNTRHVQHTAGNEMDYLMSGNPLGGLDDILTLDVKELRYGSQYACRAFLAYGSERRTVFACFHGNIGLGDTEEFKAALADSVSDETYKIILDCKDLYLSKSAVGALVAFAAAMSFSNTVLYLYSPSQQIRAVLQELDIQTFFRFLETEEEVAAGLLI